VRSEGHPEGANVLSDANETRRKVNKVQNRNSEVEGLVEALAEGAITRQQALRRMLALGISLPAASSLLWAWGTNQAAAATGSYGGSGIADRAIEGARRLNLKGKTIRVFNPAGMESNFQLFVPEWTKVTGIKVKSSAVGYFDYHPKVVQASVSGRANFDLVADGPRYIGDLVGAGAIHEIGPWMSKYGQIVNHPKWGFLNPLGKWSMTYQGKYYGLTADGDVFTTLVRKDLLSNATNQKDFKAKYGYDLTFPQTWDQYHDQAEFFTRAPQLYGAVDVHARQSGAYQWMVRYVSKALPSAYYFDDNMKPLINGPEGVKTTEEYLAMKKFMNPDIATWNYTQQYPSWANGDAYEVNYVVSLAKFGEGKDSKVRGKVLPGLMPGSVVKGKVNHRSILAFGNTFMVWKTSPVAEAAYLFAQFITSPELSVRSIPQPGYLDPYRIVDLKSTAVRKAYGAPTMAAIARNMPVQVPDLQLQGVAQYYEALDANLSAAWAGSQSAEQVVEKTATEWNKITDRIGREKQIKQWRYLKAAWPKA